MSITTVGTDGLSFSVSAASPATHDVAGFGALTWTAQDSCAIVDGSRLGATWGTREDDTLCLDGAGSKKTKQQFGSYSPKIKYNKGDAVAVILAAAFDSQTDQVSVLVTLSNGDKRYFEAQVSVFDEEYGTSGSEVEQPIELLLQTSIVKDGV